MSEYIDLSAITKRLKEVVDRSGLTSRDFAMKAGIAPATLSLNLNEKQQINVATIEEIARLKAEVRERREKGIAHITVFYDDNSFATFKDTEE